MVQRASGEGARRNRFVASPAQDKQHLGPFVNTTRINDATNDLNLPALLWVHPVFDNFLLEPCRTSSFPNQAVPPPPSVQDVDDPEYEVAVILDSKILCNKLYCLVDWLGYPSSDRTWKPVDNVSNAQVLVDHFHHFHPNKHVPTFLTPSSMLSLP